ncbi:MAG TPA: HPr family phosphocarrier protein [Haloplasmataceae bacterium]
MEKAVKAVAKVDFTPNVLVTIMGTFSELGANIDFKKDNYRVNAKSILGLLSISVLKGSEFEIFIEGNSGEIEIALEVFKALSDYFTVVEE